MRSFLTGTIFLVVVTSLLAQQSIDLTQQNSDFQIIGSQNEDYFGRAVAVGDFNGDGIDDLVAGAYGAGEFCGKAYLFWGRSDLSGEWDLNQDMADVTIIGAAEGDNLGFAVAAGDVNGDTIDDLIVSSHFADPNGKESAGSIYIFFGKAVFPSEIDLADTSADVVINGKDENAQLGFPLETGDFDNDGTPDLFIGAYLTDYWPRQSVGYVLVFWGRSEWPPEFSSATSDADLIFLGAQSNDRLGRSIVCADFDGDSKNDLALGAYRADDEVGKVYVFKGGIDDRDRITDLSTASAEQVILGADIGGIFGVETAGGDVNGDGFNDLAVSAAWAKPDDTRLAGGKVFIFYGNPLFFDMPTWDLKTKAADYEYWGQNGSDNLGMSLWISDFNADSKNDLIIGAPSARNVKADTAGNVFIDYGPLTASSPVDFATATADFRLAGYSPKDRLGWVTAVGDLNNDSITDLIAGADGSNPGGRANAGAVHVIWGNSAPLAPEVVPSFPKKVLEGEGFQIYAQVSDAVAGIENVVLNFRQGGESAFESMNMLSTGGAIYQNSISGLEVTARGVEFFISASDVAGNINRLPEIRHYSVQVRVEGDGLNQSFSGGTSKNAYHLISLPLVADEPAATPILAAEFGDYNQKEWRFFSYENQAFVENSSAAEFQPGTSHFLISKSTYSLNSGAGISVLTENVFQMQVQPGWNLIGNPYYFTVPTANFALDGQSVSVLSYENGEWEPLENMAAWNGGIVFNPADTAATLTIDPDVSAAVAKNITADENEFQIQLIAKCGDARDSYNIAAVHPDAAAQWDDYDCAEPPTIGAFVSLYFINDATPAPLTKSCLPPSEYGYAWTVGVRSNQETEMVEIEVGPETQLPDGMKARLTDESGRCLLDLQRTKSIQLPQQINQSQFFKLIVSKSSEPSAPTIVPESFELNQNFPNPFNLRQGVAQTQIVFSVPEQSSLSLTIYNLLGAEIKSLVLNGDYSPGQHVLVWDGRDNRGLLAANGIYFYRLSTPNGIQTRKMLLIR